MNLYFELLFSLEYSNALKKNSFRSMCPTLHETNFKLSGGGEAALIDPLREFDHPSASLAFFDLVGIDTFSGNLLFR